MADLGRIANPLYRSILGPHATPYYWSVYQIERATDISFRTHADLERIYPRSSVTE